MRHDEGAFQRQRIHDVGEPQRLPVRAGALARQRRRPAIAGPVDGDAANGGRSGGEHRQHLLAQASEAVEQQHRLARPGLEAVGEASPDADEPSAHRLAERGRRRRVVRPGPM